MTTQQMSESAAVIERVFHELAGQWRRRQLHHGGAGTTAAAMRAGVPSLILWLWLDQPMWAAGIQQLGSGLGQRFAEVTQPGRGHHAASRSASPAFVRSMSAFVRGQPASLGVAQTQTVQLPGGLTVLRIQFGAPSPLGLLGPRSS